MSPEDEQRFDALESKLDSATKNIDSINRHLRNRLELYRLAFWSLVILICIAAAILLFG